MTIKDTCNPCQCLGGSTDPESFIASVLTILCDLSSKAENKTSTTLAMVDKQVDDSIIRFLRTYIKDSTGTITSTVDTNLDGITAYTPTGTVDVCTVDAILLETN